MNSSQRYNLFMTEPQIPGEMRIEDFFSNREFGDIRAGFPKQGIMGIDRNMLYDANPGFINVSEDESDDENNMNLIESFKDFFIDPSKNTQRGLLSLALTGNPITGALSFFAPSIVQGLSGAGGGIINAFKNFNDRRKGRLDINADEGIMPTGIEIGAAQGSDAGFDNSDSGGYSGNANDGTSNAGTGSSDDGFI